MRDLATCLRETSPLKYLVRYRTERRAQGVTDNTINHEQAYFKAAFSTLTEIGKWREDNLLKKIKLIKLDGKELAYLTMPQIKELLAGLKQSNSRDVYMVAKTCLAIGCRWSEAESSPFGKLNTSLTPFCLKKPK